MKRLIFWVVTIAVVLFFFFPLYYMIITSFKEAGGFLYSTEPWTTLIPFLQFQPSISPWLRVFFFYGVIGSYLKNSVIVTVVTALFCTFFGTMAGYYLVRSPIKKKDDLAFFILSTRMLPPITVALPLYLIFMYLHMLDTYPALIFPYTAWNLSLATWIMRAYFMDFPTELEEAAKMDGMHGWQLARRIILPLSLPGMISAAVFTSMYSWNELLFALILTHKFAKTVPIHITEYITWLEVSWECIAVAGVILFLPIFIFTLLMRKHLIRGLMPYVSS
jgi:multiple sugar transport system permease protein